MIKSPSNWMSHLTPEVMKRVFSSILLSQLVKKAEKDYVYWDKFKHYPVPPGFTIEEAWAYLKFSRLSNREFTPIVPVRKKGEGISLNFSFTTSKTIFQQLSFIDTHTSGFLRTTWEKPTESQKSQLIISGLSEEAIASSQIEGANTSRKVAKEMLLSSRKPRTKDEQMIINNFQVMQRLLDWKDVDLSTDLLIEIQKNITVKTLEDEGQSGRLRKNTDKIAVMDPNTGEVVHTPPREETMKKELNNLIKYANQEESGGDFIHPVIKALTLHFWLAYLHPFADGNGRTARALFYWYLLKSDYWVFQYLSVSKVIKESRAGYDNSFLYSEYDDGDLTYFLAYNIKAVLKAIDNFIEHYKAKLKKEEKLEKLANKLKGFNERQIALLQYTHEHKDKTANIRIHQKKNGISYQTARTDLLNLVEKGFFTQLKDGRRFEFVPNTLAIKRLMSRVK